MWQLRGESPRPQHTTSPTRLFFQLRAVGWRARGAVPFLGGEWHNVARGQLRHQTWKPGPFAPAPFLGVFKTKSGLCKSQTFSDFLKLIFGFTASSWLMVSFPLKPQRTSGAGFSRPPNPMRVIDQACTFWHSSPECMWILKLLWKCKARESLCEGVEKPITKWLFLCFQCEKDIKCAWNFCRQW